MVNKKCICNIDIKCQSQRILCITCQIISSWCYQNTRKADCEGGGQPDSKMFLVFFWTIPLIFGGEHVSPEASIIPYSGCLCIVNTWEWHWRLIDPKRCWQESDWSVIPGFVNIKSILGLFANITYSGLVSTGGYGFTKKRYKDHVHSSLVKNTHYLSDTLTTFAIYPFASRKT